MIKLFEVKYRVYAFNSRVTYMISIVVAKNEAEAEHLVREEKEMYYKEIDDFTITELNLNENVGVLCSEMYF